MSFLSGLICILLTAALIVATITYSIGLILTEIEDRKRNPEPFKFAKGDLVSFKSKVKYDPRLYLYWGSKTRAKMFKLASSPVEVYDRTWDNGNLYYRVLANNTVSEPIPECWLKLDYPSV